ncbi:MAG: S6e family ribosomal protein [Candidatus Pacearchaeota archaeon]
MVFKINIAEKNGKTFHLESDSEELMGKELHNKIEGKDISGDLSGYEFEITGASDNAGFTSFEKVEGTGLKRVLLSYGKGMHRRPRREGKKKVSNFTPKGLRLRKTVRGKVISPAIVQINLKILKEGNKKLSEIYADQNQPKPEPEWKKKKAETAEVKAE